MNALGRWRRSARGILISRRYTLVTQSQALGPCSGSPADEMPASIFSRLIPQSRSSSIHPTQLFGGASQRGRKWPKAASPPRSTNAVRADSLLPTNVACQTGFDVSRMGRPRRDDERLEQELCDCKLIECRGFKLDRTAFALYRGSASVRLGRRRAAPLEVYGRN